MPFKFDDLPPDDPEWYSAQDYSMALERLGARLSITQRRMLAAHAAAPDLMLTVHQLAAASGYSMPNVVYSQYGRLGRLLAEALDHPHDEPVWTRLIGVDSRTEDDELVWSIEPALARAVVAAGWAQRVGISRDAITEMAAIAAELVEVAETDREALVLARLGQNRFREDLVRSYGHCMLSRITEPAVLRASHIKPWSASTDAERLDPENGLLLAAHIDALFDKGLVSFADDGRLLLSSDLASSDRSRLGLDALDRLLPALSPRRRAYLQYHREHVFRCRDPAV